MVSNLTASSRDVMTINWLAWFPLNLTILEQNLDTGSYRLNKGAAICVKQQAHS